MIYERVEELCHKKGVSIYRVEKDLNFSSGSICKWKRSIPTADKLKILANYFGVSIEYFLEEKEVV